MDAPDAHTLSAPGVRPPVRRTVVFATVSLALIMMAVDSTIVATALHAIEHGLDTTINWAGWTLTAYSFGFVLMLPISGKLSEWYGRRRVFIASVVTFTLASLCCGLADNIYVLIALRALQAAGGAGFTPSATGIVVDYFGDSRDRAVSLFGSIFPIGSMIGPIFGGLFVTYWSWRGVFFVNVPIGIAIVVLSRKFIPRDPPRDADARPGMDAFGMGVLGLGLLAGMLAASYLGEARASPWSPMFLAPLAVCLVSTWSFFRHVNYASRPFIEPHLIHGAGFGAVNLFNAVYGGITSGVIALVPLYATERYGIGALASGTLLIAQGAAAIILTLTAALALRRTGHRMPLYVGMSVVIIGMLALALHPPATMTPYAWLTAATFLIGAGRGFSNPASRNAGLQLAPEHSSTLAALRTMALQVGSIVTVSVATAVIAGAHDPGMAQAWFYVAAALLFIVALPMIARVPEHRGAW